MWIAWQFRWRPVYVKQESIVLRKFVLPCLLTSVILRYKIITLLTSLAFIRNLDCSDEIVTAVKFSNCALLAGEHFLVKQKCLFLCINEWLSGIVSACIQCQITTMFCANMYISHIEHATLKWWKCKNFIRLKNMFFRLKAYSSLRQLLFEFIILNLSKLFD